MKSKKAIIQAASYSETQQQMYDEVVDTFCVAFSRGFAVVNSYNDNIVAKVVMPYENIAFVSSINSSNIVAIIPAKKDFVYIWDIKKKSLFFGIPLTVEEPVTGLLLRPDCVIVVNKKSVNIYSLYDQNNIGSILTTINSSGAFDIPASFSSSVAVVPSTTPGSFTFFSYADPSLKFEPIKAFNKEINILRFSPNGQYIAVSSLAAGKIKLYQFPEGRELAILKLPLSESGAVDIRIDRFDAYMFVITPSKFLYLFKLDELDISDKSQQPISLKYIASFNLPNHSSFYAYFTSRLNVITVISTDGNHYNIRFQESTKKFITMQESNLCQLIPI